MKLHRSIDCRYIWACVSVVTISVCLLLPPTAESEDWTRFLGKSGAASHQEANIPTQWDATANIQWKTELPGPGSSSPIVYGDRIYLTCYSGYGDGSDGSIDDLTRHLLCIDRTSGDIVWQKSVDSSHVQNEDPYTSYITHHGYATNTPIIDGKSLFAFFGKAGVIAFDLNGNELWRQAIESRPNKTRWGSGASPILYDDKLIVNAIEECGKVFALSKDDGEIQWEYDTRSQLAYSTPNLVQTNDGQTELVLGVPEKVIGLDPESGKEKWFAKTPLLNEVNASVMVEGDLVYLYGGYQGVGSLALRAGGKGDVTDSHVLWTSRDTSYVATPVLKDKHIYWINKSGIAYCVEAETGKRVYRQRVPGVEGGRGIKFFASVVAVGDHIFAVSRKSGTFVLAASPQFELVNQNVIEGDDSDFNGTPAISNNQMFLRSNKYLYCISQ